METVQLGLQDAVLQAWKKCAGLSIPIVGRIEACVEIDAAPGKITFTLEVAVGSQRWKWQFSVNGDRCFEIDVFGPLSIQLCVSNWNLGSHSVSFNLAVAAIVEVFGIRKRFPLIDEPITIPLPLAEENNALGSVSPENLFAVLALMGAEVIDVEAEASGPAGHCRCGQAA
ncbi:MAG: hypothetical protein ACTHNP_11535 [Solirubrobacterales bacterium]